MNDRVHYGHWDLPVHVDPATKIDAKTGEALIDQFIILVTKGLHMDGMKTQTAYEEIVKKLIPKHNIFVTVENAKIEPNAMRKLNSNLLAKKDWQDVNFSFHPIIFTNGYGLKEYTVKIRGFPDNVHPGTGKPV